MHFEISAEKCNGGREREKRKERSRETETWAWNSRIESKARVTSAPLRRVSAVRDWNFLSRSQRQLARYPASWNLIKALIFAGMRRSGENTRSKNYEPPWEDINQSARLLAYLWDYSGNSVWKKSTFLKLFSKETVVHFGMQSSHTDSFIIIDEHLHKLMKVVEIT